MFAFVFAAVFVPAPSIDQLAPLELHRRAVDFLEEQRERDGSAWVEARLDPSPTPLHTPGVDAPTYWEYEVFAPDGEAAGFIVLPSGRHDFPVVHARQVGPAPSSVLQRRANGEIRRIHRFGHGNYVAEDAKHREVARLGHLPRRVEGYASDVLSRSGEERAGWFRAPVDAPLDEHTPDVTPDLELGAFASWTDLRAHYGEQRALVEAIGRHNAADDWRTEDLLRSSGETLQSKEFRDRPLLDRGGAKWAVRGEGGEHVEVELVERVVEGDTALRIWVHQGPLGRVLPVDIDVDYADGTHETLRLNVTDRIPNRELGSLPLGMFGLRRRATEAAPACSRAVIKTYYDTFLKGADRGGPELSGWGTFRTENVVFGIEDEGAGKIRLRAPNGNYVHVPRDGGDASASVATPGPDETFQLYRNEAAPARFGLRSDRGYEIITFASGAIRTHHRRPPRIDWELDYCQPRKTYAHWAGSSFRNTWKKVRRYDQIRPHQFPSTSECVSGCGATAWAMLFGFHDYEAWTKHPKWAHLGALYLQDNTVAGPDALAPGALFRAMTTLSFGRKETPMHAGAASMIWEISRDMNDWALAGCSADGQKWTAPAIMGQAKVYLDRRLKIGLVTEYDGALVMTAAGKRNAYAVLKTKRPVVIGTGDITTGHYPLAIGRDNTDYRMWDRAKMTWAPEANHRHFVVHQGHQESAADIVPYGTWMAGRVEPTDPPVSGGSRRVRRNPVPSTPVNPGVENPAEQHEAVPNYEPTPLPRPEPDGATAKPGVENPATEHPQLPEPQGGIPRAPTKTIPKNYPG